MPVECTLLDDAPVWMMNCPKCAATFRPFLRGQVQRSPRSLFSWPPFKRRDYCALICWACKDIVGWESP